MRRIGVAVRGIIAPLDMAEEREAMLGHDGDHIGATATIVMAIHATMHAGTRLGNLDAFGYGFFSGHGMRDEGWEE